MRIWESHGLGEVRIERDEMEHKIRDVAVYETLLASFKRITITKYLLFRSQKIKHGHLTFVFLTL
jgi:hypothetical protein